MECARLRAALDLARRSRSTHSAAYADPSPHLIDRPNPYDLLSRNWPFLLALTFYAARIAVRNLRQPKVPKPHNDVLEIAWHFFENSFLWPSWPRHSGRSFGLKPRTRCSDIS